MWKAPKTNWVSGDFFNVEDYNRIKGNIWELKTLSLKLWPDLPYTDYQDMGSDKTYEDISFYADEINKMEKNLDVVCQSTYGLELGEKKTYESNQPFIDADELNRIESALLRLYDNLTNQYEGRRMLTFMLGTREVF